MPLSDVNPEAFGPDTSFLSAGYLSPFSEETGFGTLANVGVNIGAYIGLMKGRDSLLGGAAENMGIRPRFQKTYSGLHKKGNWFMRNLGTNAWAADTYGRLAASKLGVKSTSFPGVTGTLLRSARIEEFARKRTPTLFAMAKEAGDEKGLKALRKKVGGSLLSQTLRETSALGMQGVIRLFGIQATMLFGSLFGEGIAAFEQFGSQTQQSRSSEFNLTQMGARFYDNRGAATMRQRSIQMIHNTQANLHQVFGREAAYIHS